MRALCLSNAFCGIIPPLSHFGRLALQKLIYGIFGFLALLVVIGFLLPRTHQVEVSVEIDAHPATVFVLINDFRRHELWSTWGDIDPNARILYSGSPRGEGAIMTWDGVVLGSGSQLITESRPYEYVGVSMNPGEDGEARSWYALTPGVGTTLVTWGFEADYGMNIVGRYFASMLGGVIARDYHDSLAQLKELAENLPSADFSDIEAEHIVVESYDIAYLPKSTRTDPAAIAESMREAYLQILTFIDRNNLDDAGAPLSIVRNLSGSALMYDAAIPIRGLSADTPRDGSGVRIGTTYAGPVVRVKHIGSYRTLTRTHRKITAYLAATGIERNGAAWESYVSDPGNTPEAQLITYVYYPVR